MSLRAEVVIHAKAIVEDSTSGFGWPITLTSPVGVAAELVGLTTDVGQTIDPDTGQAVAGRRASVVVSWSSLAELPTAVADSTRKPWVVTFADSQGVLADWKVIEVLPDRAAGVVALLLEAYHAGAHL